jgi:hypothetical protein
VLSAKAKSGHTLFLPMLINHTVKSIIYPW